MATTQPASQSPAAPIPAAPIPAAPGRSEDRLARVLSTLRMRSTFYCHAEFGDPWSLEMPAIADSVSFHVLIAGTCWLRLPDHDPVELLTGDLALVPHGAGHDLLSAPDAPRGPRVDLLPQDYLGEAYSVLRYGGPGRTTRLICGVVGFDEPAARELVRSLPSVLHVGGDEVAVATAVRDTLRLIATELAHPQPGAETVASRLADVLVVQAIRSWLQSDAEASAGWLRSLSDERIGAVIEAIHEQPGADWTLDRLARVAAMSRSSFAARFTELVGHAPIAYLTRWRMTVAHARLRESEVTVARLAGELGYRSEAAFNRAFARVIGRTPGSVRRDADTRPKAEVRPPE